MGLSHIIISLLLTSFCDSLSGHEKTIPSPLGFLRNIIGTHKGQDQKGLGVLKSYLTNLGYIQQSTNPKRNNDVFDQMLESAIKKYQEFYDLNITGTLDQATVSLLTQPRCGVPDFPRPANNSSFGSLYTYMGWTWPPGKRSLTFSYPKNIRNDARVPIAKAIIRWQKYSPFRFHYINDFQKADVKMSFERRDHGDGHPFDGPNGVLAHAGGPNDGRVHFDGDEDWETNMMKKGRYGPQTVALHELGHVLGFGHSKDPKASMYATTLPGEKRYLNGDDILGIQTLYPK